MVARVPRLLAAASVIYLANTSYVAAAADPTIPYVLAVFGHAFGGIALAAAALVAAVRHASVRRVLRPAWLPLSPSPPAPGAR